MRYFPVFIELTEGNTVLVCGGGEEALRKVRLLLKTKAAIAIVAPALHDELLQLVKTNRVTWTAAAFSPEQLKTAPSAIFCASDDLTNAQASAASQGRNIPVNVVDRPDLSTFIVPAIVDRDPLVIAIGTEGAGPVLAQGLRARIEAMLPPSIGGLVKRAASLRQVIAQTVPAGAPRRDFWRTFFFGPAREAFLDGDDGRYAGELERAIATAGTVHPGRISLLDVCQDAELLTLKAHRLLQAADVIIYDASISPAVMEYARRDAERQAVTASIWSSNDNDHRKTVLEILKTALAGRRIVRLFDSNASALDTELAALRKLNTGSIGIDFIRGVQADCSWAPLVDGPSLDQANPWRLAS